MARKRCVSILAVAALAAGAGVSYAQSLEQREAWLMKNYRFTGPPAPSSAAPADPVVSDLRQIQNMLLSIMRKADFWGDWEGAIVAGSQAAANAQLMGSINERLQAAAAAQTGPAPDGILTGSPIYFIALKDHTIGSAVVYWTEASMLHYITPQGAHVQVRLDLVDRDLSTRINRARNLEFALPQ
jgi:hypothetical protein